MATNFQDLVPKQFFSETKDLRSPLVDALSNAVTGSRAAAADRKLRGAITAGVAGTATADQLGLMFQTDPANALQVLKGAGAVEERGRKKLAQTAFQIQQMTDPAQRNQAIQNVIQRQTEAGDDPTLFASLLSQGPEAQNQGLQNIQLSSLGLKDRLNLEQDEQKLALDARRTAAQERNVSSQVANRAEQRQIQRAQGSGLTPGKPTANIKDFEFFNNLKKTDPEGARQFGLNAGFIKEDGSELSVFLQKRLSTATDEAIKSESNANNFRGLASQIQGADISGGLFGGSWGEALKDITGAQDAKTQLRKRYNAIRGSQVVNNLPPGAASDTDIKLALSGFPTDNAGGDEISSFLRGVAKIEDEKARFQTFKSEYISDRGNEKGLVREWRKLNQQPRPGTVQQASPGIPVDAGSALQITDEQLIKDLGL